MSEDQKLFLNISKGDETSFNTLFRRYHRYLVSIAYSYTNDLDVSRDLSQEVFLDVWKRRKTLKITSSLKGFLRRAVVNQALSFMKSKKHTNEIDEVVLSDQMISDGSIKVEYKELHEYISQIVASLPERCQAIFKLSRYENKSHKEIASDLGISTKTIENQMTKALRTLRDGLKEADFISIIILLILHFGG